MTVSDNVVVLRCRIVIEEDGDQFYGHCPEVGCIHVAGETLEETVKFAREAFESYVTMSVRHKDPFPSAIIRNQGIRYRVKKWMHDSKTSGQGSAFVADLVEDVALANAM